MIINEAAGLFTAWTQTAVGVRLAASVPIHQELQRHEHRPT